MAITWFVLSKTSLGLRIRSVGENPSVAEVSGISVTKTRYLCVIVGGMLMGLGRGNLLPGLQPGLELQLPDGLGFYRAGAGLFLNVESLDSAGRLPAFWNPVAALPQPTACTPRLFVPLHLANGSLYHHSGRSAAHVDQMVQNQVGRSQT